MRSRYASWAGITVSDGQYGDRPAITALSASKGEITIKSQRHSTVQEKIAID